MYASQIPVTNLPCLTDCVIVDCGEYKDGEDWKIEENDGTVDVYPPFPEDWSIDYQQVQVKLELLSAKEKDLETAIVNIKESGNVYFKQHNYLESDRKYRKVLRYISWMNSQQAHQIGSKFEKNKLMTMEVQAFLNLAAVKLKKHQYRDVLNCCNIVLEIEPKNTKALYRRAMALKGINEYKDALKDLKNAYCINPNDKKILCELKNLQNTIDSYLSQEKIFFSNMFK